MGRDFFNDVFGEDEQKGYSKLADEINSIQFKEWIEKYMEVSSINSFLFHNITSYEEDPITIIYDDSKILLPLNIFRNSPVPISILKSTMDTDLSIIMFSPSVLYKDNGRKNFICTEYDLDIIKFMSVNSKIRDITVIGFFDKDETISDFLDYLLSLNPGKLKINYTSSIINSSSHSISEFIMNSKFSDTVEIDFADYSVVLDNTMMTKLHEDQLATKIDK